jgi:2-polyprenyl-3-methyl-5-hydroxy-6-metoxy-1,4-benzoquinol methylase
MYCRFCHNKLIHEFIDLGTAPPSNALLTKEQLSDPEVFYPLKLMVCKKCWLVQIDEYKKADTIFNQNYPYFSSYSKTWLDHAEQYVNMIVERLGLNEKSHVIEIASNDGYLLQFFKIKQIPYLGIEPSSNTARIARHKGIETLDVFFGINVAKKLSANGKNADLIIGNNVLAHVPDLNNFVAGLKICLKNNGIITMEVPHLMRLVEEKQFDTIYHEHFSYFSLHTLSSIFEKHELEVFDVEELPTHGGSLRIYARHKTDTNRSKSSCMADLLNKERKRGMQTIEYYNKFQSAVDDVKADILTLFSNIKNNEKTIVAYGAPAKGNTLLNFCHIGPDHISYAVDLNPNKQGRYLPGTHLPVYHPDKIKETKPDYLLILPWNLKDEIMKQMAYIREWGGKFIVLNPTKIMK